MSGLAYRYKFKNDVVLGQASSALQVAVVAVAGLLGASQVRLDTGWMVDETICTLVVDASTVAGVALNRIFLMFLTAGIGANAFDVRRVETLDTMSMSGMYIASVVSK